MHEKLSRDISLGVIALFAILFVAGIAVFCKVKYRKETLKPLPARQRQLVALPPGAAGTIAPPHEYRGVCHDCHPLAYSTFPGWPTADTYAGNPNSAPPALAQFPRSGLPNNVSTPEFLAQNRPPFRDFPDAAQAAFNARQTVGNPMAVAANGGLLTPAQQNAADKLLVEGHWGGMELMDLTPAFKRYYRIPAEVNGVIVDEITLESAESGILAGDVVVGIEGRPTRNLKEFLRATEAVGAQQKAEVVVNRLGQEKRYTLVAKNTATLGTAQVEGAQPIRPGALAPHAPRGRACTDCHVMMASGGQLPVDPGDNLRPLPPPISPGAQAPHGYRGVCNSCHVMK